MITQEIFQLSDSEKKVQQIAKVLFYLRLIVAALFTLFGFLLIILVLTFYGGTQKVGLKVLLCGAVLVYGLIYALIFNLEYKFIFKRKGYWYLRFVTYSSLFYIVYVLLLNLFFITLFSFTDRSFMLKFLPGYATTSTIIIFVNFAFECLKFYFYFRLIKINKKFQCQKYLNDNLIEELNRFYLMEEGEGRKALYQQLNLKIPTLSWLLNKINKRKAKLIGHG